MKDRIGKFFVTRHLIDSDHTFVQMIMSRCIVVRCEMQWHRDCLEYVALSEHFDPIKEGEVIPVYTVLAHANGEGKPAVIKFIRDGNALP